MIYKSYIVENNLNIINTNFSLFYGENLGLQNEIKEKIKIKNKKSFIINIDQDNLILNQDEFFSEILNASLFDEKKIYFINQGSDKILNIIKHIEPNIDNQEIYIFSKTLDKKSKLREYFEKSKNCSAIACYPDNEITLKKIILERLKEFEGLSAQNLNLIIDNCNYDRAKLNNELKKIISFFESKKINTSELEELLNLKLNDNFNELKDEALKGNKIKTNKLMSETLFETEKNALYLNIINQRLHKLSEVIQTASNSNFEVALNSLKPPVFWKDKPAFLDQTKKWNNNKINKILKETYEIELKVKSNSIVNKNHLIKKLIVDICRIANS